jgi:phosphoglycerate dehydrogenase-like enzyme
VKVLLRGPYGPERVAFLRERLETDWVIQVWDPSEGADAWATGLSDTDAVVAMSWPADSPPSPRLALLQLPGTGLDRIAFESVPGGCAVCNVHEHEIGISEFVILALLEWEIRLSHLDAELRRGLWRSSFVRGAPFHGELHGKTVGLVGYGHIARETASRLRPFGVSVLSRTRTPSKGDEHVDDIAGIDRLDEMLAQVDYLVVTCPLTPATRGLIGAAALERLRPTAVLVNVARGEVVEEDALYSALVERRIGGAIIDTWYRYPSDGDEGPCFPSRFPFHELDNVILSPHASGWSEGLSRRRWTVIAQNLDRLARGEPLSNLARAPGAPAPQ